MKTRQLFTLCLLFTAVAANAKSSFGWMSLGLNSDIRWRSAEVDLNSGPTAEIDNTFPSFNIEWMGMAEEESIYASIHFFPGLRNFAAHYGDDFSGYEDGDQAGSKLGSYSYFKMLTTYRIAYGRWGSVNLGGTIRHFGLYFKTPTDFAPAYRAFQSNFFIGPRLSYGYTAFNLFHVRPSIELGLPIYSNNNEGALFYQAGFELFFPMDIDRGWAGMNDQEYMLKLSLHNRSVSSDTGNASFYFNEFLLELGFFYVY